MNMNQTNTTIIAGNIDIGHESDLFTVACFVQEQAGAVINFALQVYNPNTSVTVSFEVT